MNKFPTLSEQLEQTVATFINGLSTETANIVEGSFNKLAASHVAESAMTVGDIAPNFTLPGATGNSVTLYNILNKGAVVLSFYRGAWCPFCNLELRALQGILPQIQGLGATLISISPEQPDHSLSGIEKNNLEFEVLSDPGNQVARDYGLLCTVYEEMRPLYLEWGLDVPAANGDDSWELPVPATYVIDSNSVVRAANTDKDYTKRMEPDDILAALRALATSPSSLVGVTTRQG